MGIKLGQYNYPAIRPVSKVERIQKDKKRKSFLERLTEAKKGGNIDAKG